MGTHPIFESDFDCLTERGRRVTSSEEKNLLKMGENCESELTWDQKREIRRRKRKLLAEKKRPLPNEDELKKRQDEHKKRTADSKKENSEIERRLREENEARELRQKKREEKRASREFDKAYFDKINQELMSRIKGPPSPNFSEPPRRRRSTATRRSISSIRRDSSISYGDDLKRSMTESGTSSMSSYQKRHSKALGFGESSSLSSGGLQLELTGMMAATTTSASPKDSVFESEKKMADEPIANSEIIPEPVQDLPSESKPIEPEVPVEQVAAETEPVVETHNDFETAEVPKPNFVETEIEPERPVEPEKPAQKPVEKPVEDSKNLVGKSDEKTVKSTGFPDDAKSDDKQTDKEEIDVGSLNDRLTAYQSRASITTAKPVKSPENDTGKISSIVRFKSNYLRKAETPTSSSPSSVDAPTPPGTMSLRERMKMFENQNSGRTLPRETVTQAERASDIRSKISSWGQGTSSNQYHREKIHVGSIDERRNQYASMAKI